MTTPRQHAEQLYKDLAALNARNPLYSHAELLDLFTKAIGRAVTEAIAEHGAAWEKIAGGKAERRKV